MLFFVIFLGLDYVGHEDVLPYKTTEKQPIQNQLFDKFLASDSGSGQQFTNSNACVWLLCAFLVKPTFFIWVSKSHFSNLRQFSRISAEKLNNLDVILAHFALLRLFPEVKFLLCYPAIEWNCV